MKRDLGKKIKFNFRICFHYSRGLRKFISFKVLLKKWEYILNAISVIKNLKIMERCYFLLQMRKEELSRIIFAGDVMIN